jgi:uncharacterized protein (TIGR02145 family)
MVQDLMFGTCTANSFKNDNSEAATKIEPTVASGYVGHCRTSTVNGAGYFYNWPAIMNNSMAYYGSSDDSFACSSIGPQNNACKGICPTGWHVPTGKAEGEYYALNTAMSSYWKCSGAACWSATSQWTAAGAGWCGSDGNVVWTSYNDYWSSTYNTLNESMGVTHSACCAHLPGTGSWGKSTGLTVRCVKNY